MILNETKTYSLLNSEIKDSESVHVAVQVESSPSLKAIANYIENTSKWDPSLLKKEVA